MPATNEQRRTELIDAAIDVIVRDGLHGLSHRAVDEAANVPRGTTSNYFKSRSALLEAVTRRLNELHFDLMRQRRPHQGGLDRQGLIDFVSGVLQEALSRYPHWYVAMLELALESAREPGVGQAFGGIFDEAMRLTDDMHGADPSLSAEGVGLLSVFYNGILFTFSVMPQIVGGRTPGEITRRGLEKLL